MINRRSWSAWAARLMAGLCFGYVLFRPVSNGEILYPAIGLLAILSLAAAVRHRRVLAPGIILIAGLWTLLAVLGASIGGTNPGLLEATTAFAVFPAVFLIIISGMSESNLRTAINVIAVVTICLSVVILVYVGGMTGKIPNLIPQWFLDQNGAGIGLLGQNTQIRFFGLSTLVGSASLWAGSLCVGRDTILPKYWVRIAALTLAGAASLVAGRRALVLVILAAPLVALLVRSILKHRGRSFRLHPAVAIALPMVAILALVVVPLTPAASVVATAVRSLSSYFNGDVGATYEDQSIRTYQSDALMKYWLESPLYGHGLGAVIPGYSRNIEKPWMFELQYHVFLMQMGLIGLGLLIVVFMVAAAMVRRAATLRPDLTPTLVATLTCGVGLIIANASNPYLAAPGHLWAVFLPIALLNVILRSKPGNDGVAAGRALNASYKTESAAKGLTYPSSLRLR